MQHETHCTYGSWNSELRLTEIVERNTSRFSQLFISRCFHFFRDFYRSSNGFRRCARRERNQASGDDQQAAISGVDKMRILIWVTAMFVLAGCGNEKTAETTENSSGKSANVQADSSQKKQRKVDPHVAAATKKLMDRAKQLLKDRQPVQALEALSQAIGIDAGNPEIYLYRARMHVAMGEYANALADFSAAIQLAPDDARLHNERGVFMLSRKNFPQAYRDLSVAIQLNPKNAQAYNNRGFLLLAQRQFTNALNDFNKAISLDDTVVDFLNNRGFTYLKLKKIKQSLADLNRAIQLNGKAVNAYNNRGLVYMELKQWKTAIRDFSTAIQHQPENVLFYQHRRSAFVKTDNRRAAQNDLKMIAQLVKLSQLNRAIINEPQYTQWHIERAELYFQQKKYQQSIADYTTAIQLDPSNMELLPERANVHFALKEYQKAIDDCTTAIKNDAHPNAYSVRGDAYLKLQKYQEAVDDYNAAKRYDSNVVDAYWNYAKLLKTQGKKKQAAAAKAQAIALNPDVKNWQ